jgi:putative transcriptional regulator
LIYDQDKLYGARMADSDEPKDPKDPVRIGLGLRLKSAREAKEMTQQAVADLFGVNKATVSAWETGAGAPDALRLRRLARLYDVSADAILWDDSLTTEAMRFAAQFDALNDKQQRSFRAMWLAYFEEAISDDGVENRMPITQNRRSTDERPDAIEIRDAAAPHPRNRKTDRK